MSLRAAALVAPGAEGSSSGAPDGGGAVPGGLDGLLSTAPCFRGALRGYDRMQVDNYVAWAEAEIALARRESDHLISRYAACSAELANARLRLAQTARERAEQPRADQVQQLLVRAAESAAAITAAAAAEAERIRDEAREEAEARLANVAGLRTAAEAVREEAATALAEARREREAAEAAWAQEVAALRAEAAEARRQRDRAWDSLEQLREHVGAALEVVTAGVPAPLTVVAVERQPIAS